MNVLSTNTYIYHLNLFINYNLISDIVLSTTDFKS